MPQGIYPEVEEESNVRPDSKQDGELFHRLARQKESLTGAGHLVPDHVHMMVSIPLMIYALSQLAGFIKGRSASLTARMCAGRSRNHVGQGFRARGYFASTVGRGRSADSIVHLVPGGRIVGSINWN